MKAARGGPGGPEARRRGGELKRLTRRPIRRNGMNLSLSKLPGTARSARSSACRSPPPACSGFYAVPTRAAIDTRQEVAGFERSGQRLATARRLPHSEDVAKLLAISKSARRPAGGEGRRRLLRLIQGMATQSNLAIRGFTPQPWRPANARGVPIGLQLEGSYHDLGGSSNG